VLFYAGTAEIRSPVTGLTHGAGSSMPGPGGMPAIVSSTSLACRGCPARLNITSLDKLCQRGVLQGFRAYLPGFPGAQEQLFPTGQGNAQWLAGLVDNIHERTHVNMN
jgi:hypothetical protein